MKNYAVLFVIIFLTGCATQPKPIEIAATDKIGIINLLPTDMIHHKYGILDGIDREHAIHDAPFNVGQALAERVASAIESSTTHAALVIPASDTLMATTNSLEGWIEGNKSGPRFFEHAGKESFVSSAYRQELVALSETWDVDSFLIIRPYNEAPYKWRNFHPVGYSFGVFSHGNILGEMNWTVLFVAGIVVRKDDFSVAGEITTDGNAIQMENYSNEAGEPLPKPKLIEANLKVLVEKFALAAASRLQITSGSKSSVVSSSD